MPSALVSTGVQFPDNSVQQVAIPSGAVVVWNGLITNIPVGWKLCDGTNGTPDLRDRFVVGAGSSYSVNATGGANAISLLSPQLPSHSHPATSTANSANPHAHSISVTSVGSHNHPSAALTAAGSTTIAGGTGPGRFGTAASMGGGGAHSHTLSIAPAGAHVHPVSVSLGNSGAGDSHENRPPYYSVAFIMLT